MTNVFFVVPLSDTSCGGLPYLCPVRCFILPIPVFHSISNKPFPYHVYTVHCKYFTISPDPFTTVATATPAMGVNAPADPCISSIYMFCIECVGTKGRKCYNRCCADKKIRSISPCQVMMLFRRNIAVAFSKGRVVLP